MNYDSNVLMGWGYIVSVSSCLITLFKKWIGLRSRLIRNPSQSGSGRQWRCAEAAPTSSCMPIYKLANYATYRRNLTVLVQITTLPVHSPRWPHLWPLSNSFTPADKLLNHVFYWWKWKALDNLTTPVTMPWRLLPSVYTNKIVTNVVKYRICLPINSSQFVGKILKNRRNRFSCLKTFSSTS